MFFCRFIVGSEPEWLPVALCGVYPVFISVLYALYRGGNIVVLNVTANYGKHPCTRWQTFCVNVAVNICIRFDSGRVLREALGYAGR